MATATYSIRMDKELKSDFDALCDELGMSASTAFTVFAKRAVAERAIPFKVAVKLRPRDFGVIEEGELSDKELKAEIEKGVKSAEEGPLYTADEVFDEILGVGA